MSGLEHRYRRLIALYPAAHRERYQREMLSTLMDGASEDQRAPRFRETIDLLWNAIWLRLNRDGGPPVRDPRWAAASAIFGPLGALMIAGLHVMQPLGSLGWEQRLEAIAMPHGEVSWIPFAQGATWLVVAVVALLGLRRVAAILSWTTVLGTLAWALRDYLHDPRVVVQEWPLLVFGVVVAGCLTLAKGPLGLRAWDVAVFGGVSAACAVSLWADAMLAHVEDMGGGVMIVPWGISFPNLAGIDTGGALPLGLYALFLSVAALLQYRVDSGERRRLRAYAWVVLTTYVVVRAGFTGFVMVTMRFAPTPVLLNAGQWLALILVPPVTFGIAVIMVRRKDSRQRPIEIGRARS